MKPYHDQRRLSVLVTGGAGFIGSHLVERLLERNCHVTILDDLSVGSMENIEHLRNQSDLRVIIGSITNKELVRKILALVKPELVFHLVGFHFIPACVKDPSQTLEINVIGTQVILDCLREAPVNKLVFTSSGDVYKPSKGPHREEDPLGSFSIYGMSKMFCEQLLERSVQERPDLSVSVARLFNVYGPRETNAHLIPHIFKELLHGDTVKLGNRWPRRDYVFVRDVIEALVAISNLGTPYQVFNVGTGVGNSVEQVVKAIAEVMGKKIEMMDDTSRKRGSERDHLIADITKIKAAARWKPKYDLKSGLTETLEHELQISIQC